MDNRPKGSGDDSEQDLRKADRKIIFLDIDGVLNSTMYYEQRTEKVHNDIDERNIKWLNSLIETTGAEVVISSTWRKSHSVEELQKILDDKGFKGKIIDKTINLGYSNGIVRGNEIYEWVQRNKIEYYVILDDDTDMLLWQKDNFIKIDSYVGLTPTNVYKAEWILNKNFT